MANLSKKKAAKSAVKPSPKGKGKQKAVAPKPAKVPSPEPEPESDDEEVIEEDDEVEIGEDGEESSEYDSDEDSENGGVSERGMARLMELVGPEDLEEYELAQLAGEDEEDEDEDEDEEDDDDEEEGSDEEEVVSVYIASHVADADVPGRRVHCYGCCRSRHPRRRRACL